MAKRMLVILVVGLVLSMSYASVSHAGYRHGHDRGGLYAAGALVGGLLIGTVIGSAISQPRYFAPASVYAYPSYGSAYATEDPPGEWVVVPGRWVNGTWVPAHKVWAPVNPY
jgi:hypothetical protein